MTLTLTEIKEEILPKLTLEEKLELSDLLATDEEVSADNALWDAQLREDSKPGGKLFALAQEALAEDARGNSLPDWP